MNKGLRASRQQEARGAQALGGSVNSGSGNGPWRKNDVRTPQFSIEYKRTDKKSYTFKLDELLAAERNALLDNRTLLFGVELGGRNWIMLREEDFIELTRVDIEGDT